MSNSHLSKNWIIEQSKEVSFKKGTSFVEQKKVKMIELMDDTCIAEVDKERVCVHNYQNTTKLIAECSCPKLKSVTFFCQHIAATLLYLLENQSFTRNNSHNKYDLIKEKKYIDLREKLPLILEIQWNRGWQNASLLLDGRELSLKIENWMGLIDWDKYCIESNLFDEIEKLKDKPFASEDFLRITTNLQKEQLCYYFENKEVQLVEQLSNPMAMTIEYVNSNLHLQVGRTNYLLLVEANILMNRKEMVLLNEQQCNFLQQLFVFGRLELEPVDWPYIKMEILPKLSSVLSISYKDSFIQWENKKPLEVHLYLDRFKDQLLISLDFKYDQFVFNPFTFTENIDFLRHTEMENNYYRYLETYDLERVEEGYVLSDEEKEYDFLQYGIRNLPATTKLFATAGVKNRIVPAYKFPKIKVKVKKERTNWLHFNFDVLGLSKDEIINLMEAIRLNKKYYSLQNGTLLSLDLKEKEQIQKFLNGVTIDEEFDPHQIEIPLRDSLPFVFSSLFETSDSFKQLIETIYDLPKELPPIQAITLKEYQLQGIQWMRFLGEHQLSGVLADDMGLGKTIQAIGYIATKTIPSNILILCPASVVYQWEMEVKKLLPTREVLVIDGDWKERRKKQSNWNQSIIITSYSTIGKDISFYENINWDTIFFDEAQTFKNPQTQLFRTLKKLDSKEKFALTGTPIENNLIELWSIYHIVMPELFGRLDKFRFMTKEEISKRLSIFFLRRKKEEIQLGLPQKITHQVDIELNAKEKHYYAAYLAKLKEDTFIKLNREVSPQQQKIIFLAALTKLRQICCHLQLIDKKEKEPSSKLVTLMNIILDAKRQKKKVLVFSQFTKMLQIISQELMKEKISFYYLDGQTKKEARTKLVTDFNEGDTEVFLISLKAGGVGLNLTGASVVVMYDSWWNPMVENQAEDRAYRIGQKEDVHIIRLIAKGTIEDKLQELQEKKKDLVEEIFQSHQNPLLSNMEEKVQWLLEENN